MRNGICLDSSLFLTFCMYLVSVQCICMQMFFLWWKLFDFIQLGNVWHAIQSQEITRGIFLMRFLFEIYEPFSEDFLLLMTGTTTFQILNTPKYFVRFLTIMRKQCHYEVTPQGLNIDCCFKCYLVHSTFKTCTWWVHGVPLAAWITSWPSRLRRLHPRPCLYPQRRARTRNQLAPPMPHPHRRERFHLLLQPLPPRQPRATARTPVFHLRLQDQPRLNGKIELSRRKCLSLYWWLWTICLCSLYSQKIVKFIVRYMSSHPSGSHPIQTSW